MQKEDTKVEGSTSVGNDAKLPVICRNDFDDDYEDDDDFQCCGDCDLPDACSDFGCAIKQGIVKPWWFRNYGS